MQRRTGTALIYLDTSHQHLLADWSNKEPDRFAEFCMRWQGSNCALVVSRGHLLELRRNREAAVRERRYQLFRRLVPIVSDIPSEELESPPPSALVQREVLRALRAAGVLHSSDPNADRALDRWCAIFPGRFQTPECAGLLRVFESDPFGDVVSIMESALKNGAEARSRPPQTPYRRVRLGDLPSESPSEEQIADAKRQAMEVLNNPALWEALAPILGKDAIDALRAQSKTFVVELLNAFAADGPRATFASRVGADMTSSERSHTDTLVQDFSFRTSIRTLFDEYLKGDKTDMENWIAQFSMTTCPGTWLRNAVEIETQAAMSKSVASDQFDLEHIAFLPYVDLLTADQRTVQFTEQVLRRSGLPGSLAGVRPATRAANLTELLGLLEGWLAPAAT